MRYRIFCDDYILYDSDLNEFQLGNPVLKQELNAVDELTFTIYPNHPYFNNISKLSSEIKVFRDDNLLFKGRVISSELGFRGEKKIVCEGVLAFLLDTIIRPFDFPNDTQFSDFDSEVAHTSFFPLSISKPLLLHKDHIEFDQIDIYLLHLSRFGEEQQFAPKSHLDYGLFYK